MSTKSTAKKTLQNFHARSTLWGLFEIRSNEMDCSIDYLINEAMRLYATSHGFLEVDDPPPGTSPGAEVVRSAPEESGVSPSLKETMPGRVAGLPRPGGPPPLRPGMNRPSSPPT
ncbi:MAG: hypothetical protein GY854_13540, partial [Deltaproteobacteria bacterium]|nr:hypothetical protein [Deltaproteobacteria bacterium]